MTPAINCPVNNYCGPQPAPWGSASFPVFLGVVLAVGHFQLHDVAMIVHQSGYLHFWGGTRSVVPTTRTTYGALIPSPRPNGGALGKNELHFFLWWHNRQLCCIFIQEFLRLWPGTFANNHLFISSFWPSPHKFSVHTSVRPRKHAQCIFSNNTGTQNTALTLCGKGSIALLFTKIESQSIWTHTVIQKPLCYIYNQFHLLDHFCHW